MDIGFETIGNATLICHDRVPILVTDPWVTGSAYFGSWTFSHLIPDEQMDAIRKCRYIWVSHGHPDHLSSKSMRMLDAKKVLLPDHVGRRIYNSLREQGYDVQILIDAIGDLPIPAVRLSRDGESVWCGTEHLVGSGL